MSKDKKKPDTRPAAGAETSAEEAADLDAVMRKYDRESATRMWEGTPQLLIRILMAAFGVFCIGMTLFSKDMPEIRLTLFVGCIVIIGFLTYPASKHHVRVNYLPWYDIVLMVVGAFCFFYFALNAMTLVRLSTRIETVHVVIGVVGRSPFSACNWGSAVVDTVPQATTSALMSKVRRKRTSCFAKCSRISAERLP